MRYNIKIITFLGILIFIGFSDFSFAQWNINLSTLQEYNDNPFHSPFAEESFISTLNLSVEKTISNVTIGYYGNYANFSESSKRNYYWHQLEVWNTNKNILYGINVEQRLNGTEFSFYNYQNYSAYLRYRVKIKDIFIFGNTYVNVTDYSDINDLDNLLGSVNFMANKSFKTKTTIMGGMDFKYKNYFNTEFNSLKNDNIEIIGSNTAYTTQLNYFIKVAQSITPTTGMAVQYTDRNIVDGTAKTIRKLGFAYGDESKYFDDPISYEGSTTSIQLTQILPMEITLRASYFYNNKEYPSQGSYVKINKLDPNTQRNDTQQIVNIGIQKKIYFGKYNTTSLALILNYQYINNSSNSYWYNYKSNKINLGLNYNF